MTVLTTSNGEGEVKLTACGLSLLLGVDPTRIYHHLFELDNYTLPAEWLQSGRRRKAEASAHTGSEDVFAALQYWAAKEFGFAVVVLDQEAIL